MALARRQLLRGIGAGATLSLLGLPTAAGRTERVFVHPRAGLVGEVLSAVEAVDGSVVHRYDNFDFVAAEIPVDRRNELLDDLRVTLIEDDEDVGIPSDWFPSLSDILDPGDNDDCSSHPEQRTSWGWERIGAGDIGAAGAGVDVGILDTGIHADHCSLAVAGGRDFTGTVVSDDYTDRHGHGTHVAGVVGALDNDLGVMGVAPAVDLYAVKVLGDDGTGRYSDLVAGIDWCISNDVELISMSLGGEDESESVGRAIEAATEAGHLLLCAAGNEGNEGSGCDEETMTYPATHPDVVAVTAMNEDETFASYSSVGEAIDLLGPGTDILSTYADNEYARASGTSMACPFVTGTAALVWERRGETGPGPNTAVRTILADTAKPVLDSCEEGHGLVDAPAAVADDRSGAGDDDPAGDDDRADQPGDRGDSGSSDGSVDGGRDDVENGSPSIFARLVDLIRRFVEFVANLLP